MQSVVIMRTRIPMNAAESCSHVTEAALWNITIQKSVMTKEVSVSSVDNCCTSRMPPRVWELDVRKWCGSVRVWFFLSGESEEGIQGRIFRHEMIAGTVSLFYF